MVTEHLLPGTFINAPHPNTNSFYHFQKPFGIETIITLTSQPRHRSYITCLWSHKVSAYSDKKQNGFEAFLVSDNDQEEIPGK